MAAAAPAKGSGGQKTSEVDSDRLWRDRVSQELTYQRQWVEEYGFMLDEATSSRLKSGSLATAPAATSEGGNNASLSKSSTRFPSTPAVGPMLSVQRASYKILPSPEIRNDPSPFRRRKFKYM